MAEGKRPVTFRTRKLSPPAPMVLHSGGCGRVGHRRTNIPDEPTPHAGWAHLRFLGSSELSRAEVAARLGSGAGRAVAAPLAGVCGAPVGVHDSAAHAATAANLARPRSRARYRRQLQVGLTGRPADAGRVAVRRGPGSASAGHTGPFSPRARTTIRVLAGAH
jgi:hypothetical protein